MAGEIVVFVSCPESIAESIAKPLIEEKLAACVSILPAAKSIYMWQGKLCQEKECLLFIKTNRARFNTLEKRIKELHTYEVPEIIALSIEKGYAPYLAWLNNSVSEVQV
jgi:periplasmic divalent cation tolerance protein